MVWRPAETRRRGERAARSFRGGGGSLLVVALFAWLLAPALDGEQARASPPGAAAPHDAGIVPPRPTEALAAKAYVAIERLCADCHQAGRLSGPYARPAAALADILDLARIAADPTLVRPGVADASALYDVVLRRHAGVRLDDGTEMVRNPPRPDELKAVRDWIDQLVPDTAGSCAGRAFLTPEDTTAAIEQAIAATPQGERGALRFISLVPLYNSCASEAELEGHRAAVATMLNSLSWAPAPVTAVPIGPGGAVLRISLKDLGWVEAHWAILADAYPYGGLPATMVPRAVAEATRTARPLLPADWLAAAAMRPPVYYALTGVPASVGELERLLQVDGRNLDVRGAAVRAAVRPSAVTRSDRIAERLPARYGSMWRSYDFIDAEDERDLLEHPLGPAGAVRADQPFRPDGSKVMFTSPNGFFKFAVFGPDGARLAASPPAIERERAVTGAMAPGLACLSCHRSGPVRPVDSLRREADEGRIDEPARTSVLMLHPGQASIDTLIGEDRARLQAALGTAGIDPERTVRGLEPVTALAASYLRGGDLRRAAAEYGRPPEAFLLALDRAPGEAAVAARRLRHGVLPRRELRVLLRQMGGAAADAGDIAAADELWVARQPALSIWPSADRYRPGDLAAISVRTETSCHLTLIGVDTRGIATVLFPNDFEPDSLILAGKEISIPSKTAGYRFRARDEGREMVIGLCSPTARAVAGIEHDFERQRFTVLGDWKVFVEQSLDALTEPAAAKAAAPEQNGRNARRRGREPSREKEAPEVPAMTLVDAPELRVVTYEVRAAP